MIKILQKKSQHNNLSFKSPTGVLREGTTQQADQSTQKG